MILFFNPKYEEPGGSAYSLLGSLLAKHLKINTDYVKVLPKDY
jgi:hypothetical protein